MTRASMKYLWWASSSARWPAGSSPSGAATTTSVTNSGSAVTQANSAAKKAKSKANSSTVRCHMAKRHGKRVRVCFKRKAKKKKKAPVTPAPMAGASLTGLFKITPGTFNSASGAAGSYVRLILPGGSADKGPFFANPSSKGG